MEKCECGGNKYEYVTHQNKILNTHDFYFLICFKCGRFGGKAVTKELIKLFVEEPILLLHMIKSGYLVPVKC